MSPVDRGVIDDGVADVLKRRSDVSSRWEKEHSADVE